MHPPDASRTARCAPGVAIPVVLFLASAVIPASLAAQTFTRENYYEALPVPPAITAQTEASQLFHLYGDTLDTAYQDLAPRDGVDDSRGARLLWLAESFSPILRRNTNLLPLEFEDALAADVALQVDAWRDYLRVDSGTIRLGRRITDIDDEAYVLAGERLSAPDDDLLLRLLETRGPRRVRSSVHSPDPPTPFSSSTSRERTSSPGGPTTRVVYRSGPGSMRIPSFTRLAGPASPHPCTSS